MQICFGTHQVIWVTFKNKDLGISQQKKKKMCECLLIKVYTAALNIYFQTSHTWVLYTCIYQQDKKWIYWELLSWPILDNYCEMNWIQEFLFPSSDYKWSWRWQFWMQTCLLGQMNLIQTVILPVLVCCRHHCRVNSVQE